VLSSLTHPNVIAYKESFLHESSLCIVTSYCEEGDLFTRCARVPAWPLLRSWVARSPFGGS